MKRRIVISLVHQFGRPHGPVGSVVGWLLSHRGDNRKRNQWVAGLLDVRPADQVLEVGFGAGIAIAALSGRVTSGTVHGIDHSPVMVRQAGRRNAAAIRAGRVALVLGTVDALPASLDGPFDLIFEVNSLGHWPSPPDQLADLRRRLALGGRIALVSQPRGPRASMSGEQVAAELSGYLTGVGLRPERTEVLDLDPVVVCVIGS